MPFILQATVDGRTTGVPLEAYARVGSAPQCDLVIDDARMPPHAVTIVEDVAGAFRMVVKSPGLRVDGTPRDESSSIVLRAGDSVRLNDVIVSLLADAQPVVTEVAPEVIRRALAEPDRPHEDSAREVSKRGEPTAPGMPPRGAGVQIAGIAFCLAAVAAMIAWMFFGASGSPAADGSAGPVRMTLPQIMGLVKSQKDWPWDSVARDDLLDELRRAYQLENMGRPAEARDALGKVRATLLADAKRDDRGHFAPADRTAGAPEDGTEPPAAPTLTERWFPEPDRRRLYDAVATKYAEL